MCAPIVPAIAAIAAAGAGAVAANSLMGGSDNTKAASQQVAMESAPTTPTNAAANSEDANQAVASAQAQQAKQAALAKGRNSTILTGALGLQDQANIGRKTLLG